MSKVTLKNTSERTFHMPDEIVLKPGESVKVGEDTAKHHVEMFPGELQIVGETAVPAEPSKSVKELKAELDARKVEYAPNAKKEELEMLLSLNAGAPVAPVVPPEPAVS